ncbi:hypothetical protein N7535_003061 [Penicillium sp. DV-2018c]|nr:hypothetical protein N7461_001248 [Penicillium sp. DV-2018c]KAJ5576135.1 hypothetical protein N7535_003061 [Penicillium sp. DV-2018c]
MQTAADSEMACQTCRERKVRCTHEKPAEGACPECHARKVRCPHFKKPVRVPTPASVSLAPVPASSRKATGAKPKSKAVKSAANENAAATRRASRIAELQPPPFPVDDDLKAACVLSIHTTYSRHLQGKLAELNKKVTAAKEASAAIRATVEAVHRTADDWRANCMASGQ